ncbi:FecR domain-containing protein [Herminiimonas sp. KBW02]|uniref:FecR family protein n=1 Tax=Herminiimonas sp. KBW02 TaxID=2153363 RepID=UPI001F3252FF|nr:FecR domain-containing protein [Herminiimonas sp. KBW02]
MRTIASAFLLIAITSSAYADNISVTRDGVIYSVSQHETLSSISQKFTGHVKNWRTIGQTNQIENDRAIPIGRKVLIPTRLLTPVSAFARIKSFFGDVVIRGHDGSAIEAKIDALLKEGDTLTTMANSFISLMLDDGTQFTLPPNSVVNLRLLRATQYVETPRTQLYLQKGRVESHVTPLNKPDSKYEVISPLAVSGVRGTDFRVNVDDQRVLNEVLEGKVAVAQNTAVNKPSKQLVAAGYGTVVENGRVSKPVNLLKAPLLLDGYQQQTRLPIQFPLSHADASAFRVVISTDAAGRNNIAEISVRSSQGKAVAKLENLEDGAYFVRASALDAVGLEGVSTIQAFRVDARPFPPFLLQPGTKFQGQVQNKKIPVTMKWSLAEGIRDYRVQVASDAAFKTLIFDQTAETGQDQMIVSLASGNYYWRVASILQSGSTSKQGPFGDAKPLAVVAGLDAPSASIGQKEIQFSWSAAPGQHFTFQVADTPEFKTLLNNIESAKAEVAIPRPEAGVYYARVRSTDSDGFVGAFSPAQKFSVPLQWRTEYDATLESQGQPLGTSY